MADPCGASTEPAALLTCPFIIGKGGERTRGECALSVPRRAVFDPDRLLSTGRCSADVKSCTSSRTASYHKAIVRTYPVTHPVPNPHSLNPRQGVRSWKS